MAPNPKDHNRGKMVTILIDDNDICTDPCNTTYTAGNASSIELN